MAVVQYLIFATLYSCLFAYAIFLYIIRSRQRVTRLHRPTGYQIPIGIRDLPPFMYTVIHNSIQLSTASVIGPVESACHVEGWGHPSGPLSDHNFKTEIVRKFFFIEETAKQLDIRLAWPAHMSAREYMEFLLDPNHPQRTPAATMGDSGSESGDEAGGDRALRQTSAGQDELAGLVIGDQVHIPRRMAPFARALVTVYELARFSDREFDQEEYAKYMHLLISLIHSLEGRPVRWEEEDLAWTLTLEGGERYTHASEYNTKT